MPVTSLDERAGLAGKTAVVMGGAQGLGRGAVLALAGAGVDVAFCDIDVAALRSTESEVRELGRQVMAEVVDIRDRYAVEAFWTAVDRQFDRIDILVNVVGGVRYQSFLDSTPEVWDDLIKRNFWYVIQCTHHAARRMRDRGHGGSIVNITTIEGHRAAPGFTVYAGLKGGVVNFTRSAGVELAPLGVRVNCIAPDQTPTPGLVTCVPEDYARPPAGADHEESMALAVAQAANAIPAGRMGRVEDIENAILFLASDLSDYMTGETLHIDGGANASAGWFNFPGLGFRNRIPLDVVATAAYRAEPEA